MGWGTTTAVVLDGVRWVSLDPGPTARTVAVALVTVALILGLALRWGHHLSSLLATGTSHGDDLGALAAGPTQAHVRKPRIFLWL